MTWSTVYFRFFDPITGKIHKSSTLIEETEIAISRARKILNGRTKKDIDSIINIIDLMITETFNSFSKLEKLAAEADNMNDSIKALDEEVSLDTNEYLELIENHNLQLLADDINVSWEEIFALLALNCIADLQTELEYLSKNEEANYPLEELSTLHIETYYVFNAHHHLTAASKLKSGQYPFSQNHIPNEQEIITARAKKAAFKKHEPTRTLKNDFVEWYILNNKTKPFPSNAQAARQFLNSLTENRSKILAPTNAVRTLTNHLGEFLQNKH